MYCKAVAFNDLIVRNWTLFPSVSLITNLPAVEADWHMAYGKFARGFSESPPTTQRGFWRQDDVGVEVLDVDGDVGIAQPLVESGVEMAVYIVTQHFGGNCGNLALRELGDAARFKARGMKEFHEEVSA